MSTNSSHGNLHTQLNHLLADYVVMYHKLQSFHWYVQGNLFFQVHVKLEEYYTETATDIDDIAELILKDEGKPVSSLNEFLSISSIDEHKDEYINSTDVFDTCISDYQLLLDDVIGCKQTADAQDDYLVSAALDSFIEQISKNLWMLRQSRLS